VGVMGTRGMPGENLCANEQVRANLVRHLALHSRNAGGVSGGGGASSASSSDREELLPRVLVPDLAPVNPVPHLEGKEKMFDKMTNLAFSSHAAEGAHLFFFLCFSLRSIRQIEPQRGLSMRS